MAAAAAAAVMGSSSSSSSETSANSYHQPYLKSEGMFHLHHE
jgi:hypothetical protein